MQDFPIYFSLDATAGEGPASVKGDCRVVLCRSGGSDLAFSILSFRVSRLRPLWLWIIRFPSSGRSYLPRSGHSSPTINVASHCTRMLLVCVYPFRGRAAFLVLLATDCQVGAFTGDR